MGKYLTKVETDFISKSIDLSQENIAVMDVGAEAGRFSLLAANGKATVKKQERYSWLLFGRTSQSPLVPIFTAIEKYLGLRRV